MPALHWRDADGSTRLVWPGCIALCLCTKTLRSCAPLDRRGRLSPRGLCWPTTSCGAALRRTDEGVCSHVAFAGRRRAAELRSAGQTRASVPTWPLLGDDELRSCAPPDRRGRLSPRGSWLWHRVADHL